MKQMDFLFDSDLEEPEKIELPLLIRRNAQILNVDPASQPFGTPSHTQGTREAELCLSD